MTLWITGQKSANTLTSTVNINKTRAVAVPFNVPGLLPSSVFTFWCNNTDMTWAVRQSGKKLGTGLASDDKGNLSFTFYGEMNNNINSTDNITKYYQFQIKNIRGETKAVSVVPQALTVRT